jgi:drug/metabolite transporter (DMT)-like permease
MALAAAALFGSATPFSKLLLDTLPPVQMAALLYAGAALGVLPLLLRRPRQSPPPAPTGDTASRARAGPTPRLSLPWRMERATRRRLAGAILFGGVLGPVLLLLGLQRAAAGSVSLWLNLEVVATALLGFFLFKDRLGALGWAGAAGIVAASLLLSWGEGAAGLQAGLLVALACLCWGLDNHLTALIDGITPAESTFWKGTVAALVNLSAALILERTVWSGPAVAGALLVGVFAYGASIVLYITSAQRMGATRSQLVFSSAPYFGLLLAVLLLGEPLTGAQVLSSLLIAASLLLLTLERHGHLHEHAPQEHTHWHRHDDAHHLHGHDDGRQEEAVAATHSHAHAHDRLVHGHDHLPDLHHRHEHGDRTAPAHDSAPGSARAD